MELQGFFAYHTRTDGNASAADNVLDRLSNTCECFYH